MVEAYEAFNKATQDGRDMQYCSDLLDQAIASMVDVQEDKDIDSLFGGGHTTALTTKIKEQVELVEKIKAKKRAYDKLKAKRDREKQFNRKVELNTELKKLNRIDT